jgi:ABC-2 type transport system permease protein
MRHIGVIRTLAYYFTKRFMRDKVALFFTFVFPLVFLFVFGGLFNGDSGPSFTVGLVNRSDSAFARGFVDEAKSGEVLKVEEVTDFEAAKEKLGRGELDAILELPADFGEQDAKGRPSGTLVTYYDEGDQSLRAALGGVTQGVVDSLNDGIVPKDEPFKIENRSLQTANLTQFDYTFAGLVGFSIMSLGVFGMANGFASDKKVGAFRRMRVAPIRAWHIIVATGITYTLVGLLTVLIMLLLATSLLDFNMRGDFLTFMAFAALGVICMYGFGIAVAGWAKNEQQASPIANLVAFPLMFLSGAFFPRFLMPEWLQTLTAFLPLTPVIDGLRQITTENAGLLQLGPELAVLGAWTVIVYLIAFRVFRWE